MLGFSGKERRQHPRERDKFIVAYELMAPVPVNMNTDIEEYPALAADISEGGMGLSVDRPLTMDTVVRLHFELINDVAAAGSHRQRKFKLEGQIRHCAPLNKELYHVGVQFKQIAPEDIDFLAAYIKDLNLKNSE